MDATLTAWVTLVVGMVLLLLLDLFVLHRGAHDVPVRNALWSTAGFIAVGVAFGIRRGGCAARSPLRAC